MLGEYHYADSQQFISFISYWDEYNHVPWGLLYVYDFLDGWNAENYTYPVMPDTYNRSRYLTSYTSLQNAVFDTIYDERSAFDYDDAKGVGTIDSALYFKSKSSYAYYEIPVETQRVVIQMCFTFFSDNNKLTVEFIGKEITEEGEEIEKSLGVCYHSPAKRLSKLYMALLSLRVLARGTAPQ